MARLLVEAPPAGSGAPEPADSLNSDMILILAGLLCALVCVLGLGLVARCACSRRWAAAARAPPGAATANKGVKKEVLRSLPTVTYVPDGGKAAGEGADECAICLAEFACGDEVRVLPPCGHAFHAACVDTWLLCTSTCPSCRSALVLAPASNSTTDPPRCCASAQAALAEPEYSVAVAVVVERGGPCRTSVP